MDYQEFQERYEEDAGNAFRYYTKLAEDKLLEIIANGDIDKTYQIWRALKVIGTERSLNILYKIVTNLNVDYLTRYHACDALFHLAGINDNEFKGMVQYGRDKNRQKVNQKFAIEKLRNVLKEKFNEPEI